MANSLSKCPICGHPHTINEQYCPRCFWEYRLYPDKVSSAVLKMEKEREDNYRKFFIKTTEIDRIIADYKKRIEEFEASAIKNEKIIKDLESKLAEKKSEALQNPSIMKERNCPIGTSFIVGREGLQRDEILEKTVSRKHCRVTLLDDNMVEVENLSKSNGTMINGEKVERIKTSMESELKMGNYVIRIRELFPPRKTPTEPD